MIIRMLWITDCDFGVAVVCVDHARQPPAWSALSSLEKMYVMNEVLLHSDAAEVDAFTDASAEGNLAPLAHLWTVHAEYRLAQWVISVNQDRGVAPSSKLVHDQLMNYLGAAPPPLRERLLYVKTFNARKLWAVRWRRRWGAAMGTLAMGDVDDPAVLLHKAETTHKRTSHLPKKQR